MCLVRRIEKIFAVLAQLVEHLHGGSQGPCPIGEKSSIVSRITVNSLTQGQDRGAICARTTDKGNFIRVEKFKIQSSPLVYVKFIQEEV